MSSNTDHNVEAAQAMLANDKLPFHRKLTYGFTDMAGNLLYTLVGSYMLYFFTNVFGLDVGTAGALLLLGRFIDALGAPSWGSWLTIPIVNTGRIDRGSYGWHYRSPFPSGYCSLHHHSVPR